MMNSLSAGSLGAVVAAGFEAASVKEVATAGSLAVRASTGG